MITLGDYTKTWHKLNAGTEILLSQNEYNELGQLVNRNLHSTESAGTWLDSQRRFRQSVDYRYNIRGWITSINNSALTNISTDNPRILGIQERDLFGMELGVLPVYRYWKCRIV